MAIKMVVDSGCDLTSTQAAEFGLKLVRVPLTLQLGNRIFVDEEDFDVLQYTKEMNSFSDIPKTAAPSPESYMKAYEGEESVFVTCISSKLSGSYDSAVLAKTLYLEEHPDKFIHVFESYGASSGEALIALKVKECSDKGLADTEIVQEVEAYIRTQRTYFIVEKLDNLAKTGRVTPVAAKLCSLLHIRPIMGNDRDGTLRLIDKARGTKRTIEKLLAIMKKEGMAPEGRTLCITHCNNLKKTEELRDAILKEMNFKDSLLLEASGLVTNYAQEFGIILTF